ncbi:unnamed protein product [Porites lobata]|uniref:Uncharacterized protein n=1 Tax=Porites lobata TaxID=104759 RepID=A0ABN8MX06_9CNID|nr:unnamed protein product [Porites lobata]
MELSNFAVICMLLLAAVFQLSMGQEWGIAYGKRASQFDDNRAVSTGKYERLHSSFLAQDHRDKSMNHKFHFQKKKNAMNYGDKDLFKDLLGYYLAIAPILITKKLPPRQADKDKNLKRSAQMDLGSRMNDTHVHYDTIPHSWTIFNALFLVVSAAPKPKCKGWNIAYGCQFKKEWTGHPEKNPLYDKLFSEADKIRRQESKRWPWADDAENRGIKKRDYRGMN